MIRLWDIRDPARPAATGDALVGHTGAVGAAALGPRSRALATAGDDGIKLWDLDIDRAVHHICDVTGNAPDRAQWRHRLGTLSYRLRVQHGLLRDLLQLLPVGPGLLGVGGDGRLHGRGCLKQAEPMAGTSRWTGRRASCRT
ncbi:hypothetical protein [Streptomyces sp. NPDC056817]|uniref:hypothetical protein n=1 Tax=Streptomyces sp. NPDC056817 TaxID=3345950 RepID=UPI0036C6525E